MKKITAIIMAGMFLSVMMPMGLMENVGAVTTAFNSEAGSDGFINSHDSDYNTALLGPADVTDVVGFGCYLGQRLTLNIYTIYNGFLSFNTSTIPENEIIQSATLNVKTRTDDSRTDFSVKVNNIGYGNTLDLIDWWENGTYEGNIINTAGMVLDTWHVLYLDITNIDITGKTQYKLNSTNEGIRPTRYEYISIYSGNSVGNEPYLSIVTQANSGMISTYNFTQAGMTNSSQTIYPVEIIDWNNTHEQLRYEIYSHNETWLNISIDQNYTYQSISPYCNITAYGGGTYNITNTWDNTYYHIWFLREKSLVQTTLRISMSDASKGSGIFWEKWRVMISPGLTYDNTSASKISNSEYKVTHGGNYTIAITDFFNPPNTIANHSFVANSLEMDIEISVPAFPVTIYNEKSTFTEYRIYYNTSVLADPYYEFISPGKERVVYMRTGTYMFIFQYYTALGNYTLAPGNAYYFNYTIDGAYGIHLTGTNIATIYSQVNGLEQTFNQFNMALISPSFWAMENLPVVPVEGTRSFTEPSYQNGVLVHPYAVIKADIQNPQTGTSGSFHDPQPSAGTTTILNDELYVTGNYSTNLQLNLSNGWRFLNITSLPGIIDLTAYNNTANITFWANDSISIIRKTTIRNSGLFYWTYFPTTKLYITSQTLNNTTDFDWTGISWFVGFVPETEGGEPADLNSVTVYDQNNTVYLVMGQHFLSTTGGIAMDFDRLNASDSRAFTFKYYADNGTNEKTEIITINPPYYLRDWFNEDYYYGVGTWQNQYSSTFQGDIQIKIVDAGGIIDPDTVWVKDVTNDRVLDKDGIEYTFSGNTIMINYRAVGDVAQGESRQYEVYFKLAEADESKASWLFKGAPFSPIALLIALGLILVVAGGVLQMVLNKKKEGGGFIAIGLVIFMFFGIVSLIHELGGIG